MTAPLGVRFARHYFDASDPEGPTACGGNSYGFGAVSDRFDVRHPVTCKRCLASLAKRDREFRRKARRAFPIVRRSLANAVGAPDVTPIALLRWNALARGCAKPGDAARAIAREEGRAP